jgi:hypothetical protein
VFPQTKRGNDWVKECRSEAQIVRKERERVDIHILPQPRLSKDRDGYKPEQLSDTEGTGDTVHGCSILFYNLLAPVLLNFLLTKH